MMEGGINDDTLLEYAAFQISPTENRYEAFVCGDNKVETLACGPLEQLIFHLPEAKDFHSKGLVDSFKLQLPENHRDSPWFTKSTLSRFLHIVNAPEVLHVANAIEDEMSQLEEARKFHLSLYTQDHSRSGEADDRNLEDLELTLKPEVQTTSSDATKNELLRAMDLRLTALKEELAAAFNQATGAISSTKQIADVAAFAEHFGAVDLRNSLFKYLALSQKNQATDPQNEKSTFLHGSRNDGEKSADGMGQMCSPVNTVKPVKYGVSPAKVAQVECQGSSESDKSSNSSDKDEPSTERSRPILRSASPRRSASPMRRIQIGRSGSHRATALTIKSLNYFPNKERVPSNRDIARNSSDEEESDQPQKKRESNVRRMSVQDAINLFESKQRGQTSDLQKGSSSADISVNTNKSVLRRWSSGMGDSSTQCLPENASEGAVQIASNNLVVEAIQKSSMVLEPESNFCGGSPDPVKNAEKGTPFETEEKGASYPTNNPAEEISDRVTASAEWNQQNVAELNQMLMKMMESSKPVRRRNIATGNSNSQEFTIKQRGDVSDHHKEQRDEKLQGANSGKRAEKEAQFKAMQEGIDQKKAKMNFKDIGVTGKKDSLSTSQKTKINSSPSMPHKKETSKPAISRKALPKASPLPATRKSWPSTPTAKTTRTTPTKAPNGISAGTTPTHRKPQPTPSQTWSGPKVERSQRQQKNVKGTQTENKRNLKEPEEKQHQSVIKTDKTMKVKVLPASGYETGTVPAKPSFYSKVTKKSSVVPVESKPFLRKGSGIGPGVGPVVIKTKASQSDESLKNNGNLIRAQEEVVAKTAEPMTQQQEGDMNIPVSDTTDLEAEGLVNSHQKIGNTENSDHFVAEADDSFQRTTELAVKIQANEEPAISSIAWVEIEDQQELPVSCDNSLPQIALPANVAPVVLSSSRVHHSLSQMLQEDIGEPDIIEWGHAEIPPAMIYQKEAPKGLKRLLKFARKSRGEANVTGWSSPSVFSEGEEDAEEPKAACKRNADTLLRKAAHQAKGFRQQKTSFGERHDSGNLTVQSNISEISPQSSRKLQEGHISASATSTKATRSFFSLSTFRSSK